MSAKRFDIKMVSSGGDTVTAPMRGHGDVEFDLKARDLENCLNLRRRMAMRLQGRDLEKSQAEAAVAMMELAVDLVMVAITPEVNEDEAVMLVSQTGGINGKLIRELALRFGVADILVAPDDDDVAAQDEIPT